MPSPNNTRPSVDVIRFSSSNRIYAMPNVHERLMSRGTPIRMAITAEQLRSENACIEAQARPGPVRLVEKVQDDDQQHRRNATPERTEYVPLDRLDLDLAAQQAPGGRNLHRGMIGFRVQLLDDPVDGGVGLLDPGDIGGCLGRKELEHHGGAVVRDRILLRHDVVVDPFELLTQRVRLLDGVLAFLVLEVEEKWIRLQPGLLDLAPQPFLQHVELRRRGEIERVVLQEFDFLAVLDALEVGLGIFAPGRHLEHTRDQVLGEAPICLERRALDADGRLRLAAHGLTQLVEGLHARILGRDQVRQVRVDGELLGLQQAQHR